MNRFWVHCDLWHQAVHVLAVAEPLPVEVPNAAAVAGFAYRRVPELQAFLSHAIDVTHGDADALLMGAEMQGKQDLWLTICAADYERIVAMGDVIGCQRTPIQGYRVEHGRAFLVSGDGLEPEIPQGLMPGQTSAGEATGA